MRDNVDGLYNDERSSCVDKTNAIHTRTKIHGDENRVSDSPPRTKN